MGGENSDGIAGTRFDAGSSPRGRGKLQDASRRLRLLRLIPAWAGKTSTSHGCARRKPAHPRVGGENVITTSAGGVRPGSSPRGRGKRTSTRLQNHVHGLIPAWAGKTFSQRQCSQTESAHPRVGGENTVIGADLFADAGSSPRGRGKRSASMRRTLSLRLIPAWAGKTSGAVLSLALSRAHPRVGGENAS